MHDCFSPTFSSPCLLDQLSSTKPSQVNLLEKKVALLFFLFQDHLPCSQSNSGG